MKQVKSGQYIVLNDIDNPKINQIIVMLKDDVLSFEDEAVEKTRAMVDKYMVRYHKKNKPPLKSIALSLGCVILGVALGFLI